MDSSIIKRIIREYQHLTEGIEIVKRDLALDPNLNYVLVGLRRAGKSFILYQQMKELLSTGHTREEFLYLNFEDDRLQGLQLADLDILKQCYEEMFPHKPIFFLDEIQIIDGWEHFARRLADQNYRVYITGSNSRMLSKEIASTLGGRFMVANVYPYSFKEHLRAQGIPLNDNWLYSPERASIVRQMDIYFFDGGLPEIEQVTKNLRRSWLSNIYNKIFFGDIVLRYSIRNTMAMKVLMRKLAENVKQASTFSRLANIVSSVGTKVRHETIIDYLTYIEESCLIFSIENFAAKVVEKSSSKKYYFADNGLLNIQLIDSNSALLENLVAIHLHSLYHEDLMFYNSGIKVDFYLWKPGIAIQSAYSIQNDENTREREIKALRTLAKRQKLNAMYIITYNEREDIRTDEGMIRVIPIWEWLLSDDLPIS